jgi:putative Mn2+ efflux pump MntP
MPLRDLFVIAVGLALDAAAVSLAAGASGRARGRRAAFRLSFHFGLFQAVMPILGWWIGDRIAAQVQAVDHWIAFGLLALVGLRMIVESRRPPEIARGDPSRGRRLMMLSIATSVDAFAVGFSLAMVNVRILLPAAVIGVVTAALSLAALHLGRRLRAQFGQAMEFAGGVILLAVGAEILAKHLGH